MKKGFIELIIVILFAVLSSITFLTLKIAINNFTCIYLVKNKTQSRYYAEIGLNYAIKGIKDRYFTGNSQFYLLFKDSDINIKQTQSGKKYAYIKISCTNGIGYKLFNITAKGVYDDYITYLSDQITIEND